MRYEHRASFPLRSTITAIAAKLALKKSLTLLKGKRTIFLTGICEFFHDISLENQMDSMNRLIL